MTKKNAFIALYKKWLKNYNPIRFFLAMVFHDVLIKYENWFLKAKYRASSDHSFVVGRREMLAR